jgi:RNA polymerase sigma-70 factor (sigma-E family)
MMASMALRGTAGTDTVRETVGALYREHYRPLVRLAALLLDDVGAAEEVTQDAFVKLQVGWGRVREQDRAPAWLRSAVLNGARSRMRRRQVRERHRPDALPDGASAEAGALLTAEHDRMLAAVRELPARQCEALLLRFYLDLSEMEMAEVMGISTGSVKTHVHRGLAALRAAMEEER